MFSLNANYNTQETNKNGNLGSYNWIDLVVIILKIDWYYCLLAPPRPLAFYLINRQKEIFEKVMNVHIFELQIYLLLELIHSGESC